MRQFAAQRAYLNPAAAFALNADSPTLHVNQLLLLAIERALAPPLVHRRMVFQPMSIVVVDPTTLSQTNPDARQELTNVLPRALPPAPGWPCSSAQYQQRTIRGEILSDEHGRLYEKLGRQIRPIHQLASGQFGDVIDLVPSSPSTRGMITAPAGPKVVEAAPESKPTLAQSTTATENESGTPSFSPLQPTQPQNQTVSHRKLFADPGQWRVVWWGEFKEILAPQLAHPERLKDAYRLPCYVQVLETERVVTIEELAAVYKSNKERPARLYLLTDEIAAKLDLVLPLRPAPSPATRRGPNTLLAHERVFRLLIANDPTIDVVNFKSSSSVSTAKVENSKRNEVTVEKAGSVEKTASVNSLKQTIPERFVNESAFKISREEALYDQRTRPSVGDRICSLFQGLKIFKRQHEMTKWRALLTGRSVDEQLWLVRPPAGMLTHTLIQEWARTTLEIGGYDSEKMSSEWELFWRRKGF